MKLKPCPFCGKEIKEDFPDFSRTGVEDWVLSHFCCVEPDGDFLSILLHGPRASVIERWNRRVNDDNT